MAMKYYSVSLHICILNIRGAFETQVNSFPMNPPLYTHPCQPPSFTVLRACYPRGNTIQCEMATPSIVSLPDREQVPFPGLLSQAPSGGAVLCSGPYSEGAAKPESKPGEPPRDGSIILLNSSLQYRSVTKPALIWRPVCVIIC